MLECKQTQIQQFFSSSRAHNYECSNLIIPIIKFIRDLIVIYIETKFGAYWFILADARV